MHSIQLPVLHSDKANTSTKDCILTALASNWPLTARKIYAQLKKQGTSVTYQAVHKALQDLAAEKVVIKQDNEYAINLAWTQELQKFAQRVEQRYSDANVTLFRGVRTVEVEKDVSVLTFDTIEAADQYVLNFPRKTKKTAIGHARHFWWALFYLKNSFDAQTNKLLGKTYGLCRGNTVIDGWCSKFENAIGMHSRSGVDCAQTCDIYVYDDYVIQVFIPSDIVQRLDRFYEETKDMFNVNFKKLISTIYERKTEVTVIVKKDDVMTSRLRRETLQLFEK